MDTREECKTAGLGMERLGGNGTAGWEWNGWVASTRFIVSSGGVRLKDTGMASAWAMARRRAKEYRRKVDVATRFSGVCPRT